MKILLGIVSAFLVLAALYAAYLFDYLLFHSVAELFSIIIACGMFAVAWNSRQFLDNQYLLVIGIAYLFIGILDLAHLFSYKGVDILPAYGGNVPTQLWIAARYLESLSLLLAPVMIKRQIRPYLYVLAYGTTTFLILLSIFDWRVFPDCFLDAAGGLTRFKIISEYIICLILIGAGILIFLRRLEFNPDVFGWILASIFATILAELAFTQYISVYGQANLLGHYLKIISFFCVYKAVIEIGLAEPYESLFRNLKQSKDRYESLFTNMIDGFASHRAIFAPDGTPVDYVFLEVNPAFEKLTGLHNVVGKNVTEIIPGIETDPADWIGKYGKVAATGIPARYENYSEQLNKWYSVSVYSPSKGLFATVFEDITERKQHQNALQKSRIHFKLLSEISGKLLTAKNSRASIGEIGQAVMEDLDCQIYLSCLVDESGEHLTLNAFSGIPEKTALRICGILESEASNRATGKTKPKITAADLQSASDRIDTELRGQGVSASLSLPLVIHGNPIGILSFGSSHFEKFPPEETAVIKTSGDYITQALQRIQTRQRLKEANVELEKKVQKRTRKLEKVVAVLRDEIELRRRAEKNLQSANKRLSSRADQLRALTGKLTMVEQKERKRLARVLHDGLQQHMVTAKFILSGISRQLNNDELKTKLLEVESMMGECVQMSRSLSTDLCPPVFHKNGLTAGLKWIKQWMKDKHDFDVDLAIETHTEFQDDVAVLVFESLRELLFNAVKHAGVSKAKVRLSPLENVGISIQVSDKGVGFDPHIQERLADKEGGFGLFSIQERISLIGGIFEIDSTPGTGSCFTLSVPTESQEPPN